MDSKTDIFLEVINKHRRLIYKIVNGYCKNRAAHEDLVQEIILQLWLSFKTFKGGVKHSTWIYRIALNTAISFYRKGQNEQAISSEFLPQHEHVLIESEKKEEDPNIQLLYDFIHELKEIDRALILLYLDGLSHKQIAEIIGLSPTNVGTKINRIKKTLTNKFQSKLTLNNDGK